MSWALFFLLVGLYPIAFFLIAIFSGSWTQRLVLFALLGVPAAWYCWPYFAIQSEHEQMCAAEGGLRVLIQPEKVDRVRFVGSTFGHSPAATLEKYQPRVKVVEALTEYRGTDGKPLPYYVAYTAEPNPKAGQWVKGSNQEGKFVFPTTRLESLDPAIFEVATQESPIPHGRKTEVTLSKGGKVYARHIDLVHWWNGIQYPDAVPSWRCPDRSRKYPPADEPYASVEKWRVPDFGDSLILDLIFK